MAGIFSRLRRLAVAATVAGAGALAVVPIADAQWFPFGAAPPGEIVQRLRAEGYILVRPLERKDTVYLADVMGDRGRERLVLDAWSGEILQRFVVRRGRGRTEAYMPEGGEFTEPPPLGPPPARDFREGPPARDFREGNPNYGSEEAPPRARVKSKPSATARRSAEPKPSAQPAAAPPSSATPPTAAAPAGAPASTGSPQGESNAAKSEAPPSNASSGPAPGASAPASSRTEAKEAAPPASPARSAPSPPAEKQGEKKVNDVPVNPLD
jgi:hypothetical protein